MSKLIKLTLTVLALFVICGCGGNTGSSISDTRDMLSRADGEFKPDEVITYKHVDGVELALDVFYPHENSKAQNRAAIVTFFGGGWNMGGAGQFYRQSRYWADRGMVAICADYRVRSRHNVTPDKCLEDAKSAMRWVRSHSKELGIDPDRIAAAGGSAGGHLAAATAMVKGFDAPGDDLTVSPAANALVLFNPVIDNGPEGYGYDRVKDYWQKFSPFHNIDGNAPPAVFFLGTEDHLIPVDTAWRFKNRIESKGGRCDLFIYQGQGHGFFNYEKSRRHFFQTLLESDRFLESIGYLRGRPLIEEQQAVSLLKSKSSNP
ncbi:Acetylxylan esterase precursor [Limihaloglobus sulfuriphilus]|uniref:Acetylxylan esterase n=1 Tax=Limihaloglobus sulfuriphilus TaxID=1851148 RepID=A0A1Q2MHZ2_9BACT|nr:alpha/beta hydrolase [Limihaloglobus sulfuriphilus]AQQ72325.1 Acetylxylan esterase precursor [Limihaloglobus sulfuriphilus]